MNAIELGKQPSSPCVTFEYGNGKNVNNSGLTKRELFAAMAMQGLLSAPLELQQIQACVKAGIEKTRVWAYLATEHADRLLAELAKEQP